MKNQRAWELLDEALFTSANVKVEDKDAGETDWDSVYPTTAAETDRMERLINEAERAMEDPDDPDLKYRKKRLLDIVSWSRKRHRTWKWTLILGALLAIGIMWYFNNGNEQDKQKALADVASVEAWSEQDTIVAYGKLPESPDYGGRLASANKWKVYRMARAKIEVESYAKTAKEYRQKADTCTQAERKESLLKNALRNDSCKEVKQQEYKELAAMKYAEVKAAALKEASRSLERQSNDADTTRFWMIYMAVMTPLYILTGYRRGYVLTSQRRKNHFLEKTQNLGFAIASFFFGTGLALSLLPDYIVETRWNNGRTERHSESNPGNILVLGIKGGLMVIGAFIFSFLSILLITIHVIFGMLNFTK